MELAVFWTQFSEDKLKDIFSYYKQKAGLKVALKVINEIVEKTNILQKQPRIGAIEDFLIDRPQEFRYLVSTL